MSSGFAFIVLADKTPTGRLATEPDGKSSHKCASSKSAIHTGMCPSFRRAAKILKLGRASNGLHETQNVMHDHNQHISIIPDSCPFLSICGLDGMGLVNFAQITVKIF